MLYFMLMAMFWPVGGRNTGKACKTILRFSTRLPGRASGDGKRNRLNFRKNCAETEPHYGMYRGNYRRAYNSYPGVGRTDVLPVGRKSTALAADWDLRGQFADERYCEKAAAVSLFSRRRFTLGRTEAVVGAD